jgi:galactofuranosylgalactofuranosylrhamnosyl-N-acetylglucosaminyl-diphospho-decaprenol beta-1,5/1,6-galactofuranosyltransferase
MNHRVIQRCVFPTERRHSPLYYRLDRPQDSEILEPRPPDRFSICIGFGSKLITDTYFNSFFECYWRRFTRLGRLRLRVRLTGRGTLLLLRRSLAAGLVTLDSIDFDADDSEVFLDVPEAKLHHRELGALHFDVVGRSPQVQLHRAEWVALDSGETVASQPVSLVAGYCTFNREEFLLDNVRVLLEDEEVADLLKQIIVVDQGSSKVKDHPAYEALAARAGSKLQVIEQDNFGGCGGFTRSILEARSVPGATHMLLMDDDAVTEPENVFRTAAFQALAREDMGVGGQMLDMLRPMEVYEAGALLDPGSLKINNPIDQFRAESAASLEPFLEVNYVHYNAWWFFSFPLRLLDRVGLPLPLFIRGDDIEFGFRLFQAGITTTTLPGLGVWHEPFYLKRGGWQAYYDLRNMLILTSVHVDLSPKQVAKIFLRRLVFPLLSLNYYEAAILCEAVDDYLKGPKTVDGDPRELHKKLQVLRRDYPQESVPRSRCLPIVEPASPPVSLLQRRWHLLRCIWNQLTRPSPPPHAHAGHVVPEEYARWWTLSLADVIGVEDWHTDSHRIYRRSRESMLKLARLGLKTAIALYRNHVQAAREWRAAKDRLTTTEYWHQYLGIEPKEREDEVETDQAQRAA